MGLEVHVQEMPACNGTASVDLASNPTVTASLLLPTVHSSQHLGGFPAGCRLTRTTQRLH